MPDRKQLFEITDYSSTINPREAFHYLVQRLPTTPISASLVLEYKGPHDEPVADNEITYLQGCQKIGLLPFAVEKLVMEPVAEKFRPPQRELVIPRNFDLDDGGLGIYVAALVGGHPGKILLEMPNGLHGASNEAYQRRFNLFEAVMNNFVENGPKSPFEYSIASGYVVFNDVKYGDQYHPDATLKMQKSQLELDLGGYWLEQSKMKKLSDWFKQLEQELARARGERLL